MIHPSLPPIRVSPHHNQQVDFLYNVNSSREVGVLNSMDARGKMELQLWASYRAQTLARTVRGMMYYEQAIRLLAVVSKSAQCFLWKVCVSFSRPLDSFGLHPPSFCSSCTIRMPSDEFPADNVESRREAKCSWIQVYCSPPRKALERPAKEKKRHDIHADICQRRALEQEQIITCCHRIQQRRCWLVSRAQFLLITLCTKCTFCGAVTAVVSLAFGASDRLFINSRSLRHGCTLRHDIDRTVVFEQQNSVPLSRLPAGGGRRLLPGSLSQRQHGQRQPVVRAERQAGLRVCAPGAAEVQLGQQGGGQRKVLLRGEATEGKQYFSAGLGASCSR